MVNTYTVAYIAGVVLVLCGVFSYLVRISMPCETPRA